MKKLRWAPAALLLLCLAGCGGAQGSSRAEELALTARGEYLAATSISTQAVLTADYGQRVYQFTVQVDMRGEETTVTLLQPETVAGMTARLSPEGNVLEYDGALLELGTLDQEGLTPVGGVSAMVDALREGYVDSCTLEQDGEEEQVRILCRDPELPLGSGTEYTLWLDPETLALEAGEAAVDGETVLRCQCETFTWETGET